MKSSSTILLSIVLTTPAAAAVAGTTEPSHPGRPPALWAALGNDDLTLQGANGTASDDHRTNEVTIGLCIDPCVLVIDHAILTDRHRRTRSDELTMTLGWMPFGEQDDDGSWVAIGGGARFVGNLYGDAAQGRWHRVIDANAYKLAYGTTTSTSSSMQPARCRGSRQGTMAATSSCREWRPARTNCKPM